MRWGETRVGIQLTSTAMKERRQAHCHTQINTAGSRLLQVEPPGARRPPPSAFALPGGPSGHFYLTSMFFSLAKQLIGQVPRRACGLANLLWSLLRP